MSNTRIQTRNSAFELLRIVSILMIILHHFVLHGIIDNPISSDIITHGSNNNLFFLWLFFPGGEVGVALFFMITGFFCINTKTIRIKKIILEVLFYSWFSLVLYLVLKHFCVNAKQTFPVEQEKLQIIKSLFFPIRSGFFWFATAYILLRLFLPVYNAFLEKLNLKGFIFVIFVFLFAFMQSQLFIITLGYTKALFFYSIGGFIKRFCSCRNNKRRYLFLFVFFLSWILYACIKYYESILINNGVLYYILKIFARLIAPCILVPISSISIFFLFSSLSIHENKVINTVAATTFGVYLLHDSYFIRYFLWYNIIKVQEYFFNDFFPIFAILICLALFFVCSLVDMIRLFFIEKYFLLFIDNLLDYLKKLFFREESSIEKFDK